LVSDLRRIAYRFPRTRAVWSVAKAEHGELVAVGAVPSVAGAGGGHVPRLHHPLPLPLRQPAQGYHRRDSVDRPLPQIRPLLQVKLRCVVRFHLRPMIPMCSFSLTGSSSCWICRQRVESDPTVPDAPAKAEKFAQRCVRATAFTFVLCAQRSNYQYLIAPGCLSVWRIVLVC
jgi:hypothetical protein